VVLDSQVHTPLGLQNQNALTVCVVYRSPRFSSDPRKEGSGT